MALSLPPHTCHKLCVACSTIQHLALGILLRVRAADETGMISHLNNLPGLTLGQLVFKAGTVEGDLYRAGLSYADISHR